MAPPSGESISASAEEPIALSVLPRGQPRAEGPASVLGIGTAVPPTEFLQSEYPDFFFEVTKCSEKEALKAKFKRICKSSFISSATSSYEIPSGWVVSRTENMTEFASR